jgi:hypothetical protein
MELLYLQSKSQIFKVLEYKKIRRRRRRRKEKKRKKRKEKVTSKS